MGREQVGQFDGFKQDWQHYKDGGRVWRALAMPH